MAKKASNKTAVAKVAKAKPAKTDKGMTVAHLQSVLKDKGIAFKAKATKAELQKLVDEAVKPAVPAVTETPKKKEY